MKLKHVRFTRGIHIGMLGVVDSLRAPVAMEGGTLGVHVDGRYFVPWVNVACAEVEDPAAVEWAPGPLTPLLALPPPRPPAAEPPKRGRPRKDAP